MKLVVERAVATEEDIGGNSECDKDDDDNPPAKSTRRALAPAAKITGTDTKGSPRTAGKAANRPKGGDTLSGRARRRKQV